eukprot:4403517-Pyramimonas_sp.AAC.1
MSDADFLALCRTIRMTARSLQHDTCGKALSVYLGSGGYQRTWEEPTHKYIFRIRHVRAPCLGLATNYICVQLPRLLRPLVCHVDAQ